jgi:hypothetical protein
MGGINNNDPNNIPSDNSLLNTNQNNLSNTKTNESEKAKQIINGVDYSIKNNAYLFKYFVFQLQDKLSELLYHQPLLFRKALKYIDWLIASPLGQMKPWELIDSSKASINCWCGCKGKRPHQEYDAREGYRRDNKHLSYYLTYGLAFYDSHNYPTADFDIKQIKVPVITNEVIKQLQGLSDYFGLPFFPTPYSDGFHLVHSLIKGQRLGGCQMEFKGKVTDYNPLKLGQWKSSLNQLVVHPFTKNRLPAYLKKEWSSAQSAQKFFSQWERRQKQRKRYRYISKQRDRVYSRFGIYFTQPSLPRQLLPTEKEYPKSFQVLENVSLSVLGSRRLTGQKNIGYDPYQITCLLSSDNQPKQLILNAEKEWQRKQLLPLFLKNDGSPLQFQFLQLSQDFRLQRWKLELKEQTKTCQQLPLIPKTTGQVWVKQSRYGNRIIEGDNGGFYQQIIYTDADDNQEYSVLFNCDNTNGDSSSTETPPWLDSKIGNFASTFYLQAGKTGSFIKEF